MKITGAADKPLAAHPPLQERATTRASPSPSTCSPPASTCRAICNLVFLRRVRSRILYEQMLGRATRLCDEIGKEVFRIFDAVDLYEALEAVTTMKPVVANPNFTFAQLVEELAAAKDEAVAEQVLDQLVAKLQRKRRRIEGRAVDPSRQQPACAVTPCSSSSKTSPAEGRREWFGSHHAGRSNSSTPEHGRRGPSPRLAATTTSYVAWSAGYGTGREAQGLPGQLCRYLHPGEPEHGARAACRHPAPAGADAPAAQGARSSRWTKAGYTEAGLQTAWRDMTNQDIAASIIGFIRQRALGEPLVPYASGSIGRSKAILGAAAWIRPAAEMARADRPSSCEIETDHGSRRRSTAGSSRRSGGFTGSTRCSTASLSRSLVT